MKTVVAYYSLGGTSRKLAEERARSMDVPCIAVEEVRKRSIISAFTAGCYKALQQKPSAVKPISEEITGSDRLIVFAPVWAGMPAPAYNSLVNALHSGQEVEVVLVSGSGESKAEPRLREQLEAKGAKLIQFTNVKAPEK
ncbi:MAG: hypothetical protein GXY67_06455 [Clostridiales bacterium]|nr:hypothetical protein [Clostridiales bacterium]